MPVNVKQFEENVRGFNEKYNVHFSMETFVGKTKAFGMIKGQNAANEAYRVMFGKVCSELLTAVVGENVESADLLGALEDFETMVMAPYAAACKEQDETEYPQPYGGMSKRKQLSIIGTIVENFPKNQIELAERAYLNGETRIRDMVAFTKGLVDSHDTSRLGDVKKACAYIRALDNVNSNRSFWWKLFHPFRNNAEQRDAAVMRNLLKGFEESAYEMMMTLVEDSPEALTQIKNQISAQKQAAKLEAEAAKLEEVQPQENKEEVKVEEKAAERAKIFQIGYRPNVDNLAKDVEEANLIAEKIKSNKILSTQAKKICSMNIKRLKDVKAVFETQGKEVAKSSLERNETNWANRDGELREKNPEYKPNTIEDVEMMKEPIKIEIDEKGSEKISPKIEEGKQIDVPVISSEKH